MKKFVATIVFILYIAANLHAQPLPEQDCLGAIPIINKTYAQLNSFSGAGSQQAEINPNISCLLSGELNSVWYKLRTTTAGTLCFNLIPVTQTDDYDWGVYKLTNNSCSSIYADSSLEVLCNFANNSGNSGTINVLASDLFYIYIGNYSATQSGYLLDFTCSTAAFDTTLQQVITINNIENPFSVKTYTYPNPATNSINIALNCVKPIKAYTLHIYNNYGMLVKQYADLNGTNNTFDVSALAAGLYTYCITTTTNQTAYGRFVKE